METINEKQLNALIASVVLLCLRCGKVAKQVVMRQAETKRHITASGVVGFSDVVLPDNLSRWVISNCINLGQGTTQDDAIGSQITVSGISLKLQFKYTQPFAPYFKLFVVEANAHLLGGSNTIFENTLSKRNVR